MKMAAKKLIAQATRSMITTGEGQEEVKVFLCSSNLKCMSPCIDKQFLGQYLGKSVLERSENFLLPKKRVKIRKESQKSVVLTI